MLLTLIPLSLEYHSIFLFQADIFINTNIILSKPTCNKNFKTDKYQDRSAEDSCFSCKPDTEHNARKEE